MLKPMKTKKIIALCIGLIVIVALIITGRTNGGETAKTIRIGAILPLSGTQAFTGEGMRDALELAWKNVKGTKYSYELIVEDGAFDAKASISAANKLISIDKVDAIIDAYAPIGNVVAPITEKARIVHIGVGFDPKAAEGDYNFILFTTPETAAKSFLAEMQRRNLHTLGIFRVNNSGIFAVYSAIKLNAHEYGITIISDEMFQPGERDFKSLIVKGSTPKADLYALLALSPELEILAKQLYEQNIHNLSSTIYFELAKDKSVFEGLWSIGYGKVASDFEAQYKSTYNRELGFGSANVYDAFNVIMRAAETSAGTNKPSPQVIASQIQGVGNFSEVLGELRVNDIGIIDTPTMVKMVKEGKMKVVE
jgi:branched-chain amino acid transport system substrate-binding protein